MSRWPRLQFNSPGVMPRRRPDHPLLSPNPSTGHYESSSLDINGTRIATMDNVIIGIHYGHDASVAAIADGQVVFVEYEDRLSHIKHHQGFPIRSLQRLISDLSISRDVVVALAFSSSQIAYTEKRNNSVIDLEGNATHYLDLPGDLKRATLERLAPHKARWGSDESRFHSYFEQALRDLGLFDDQIRFLNIAHHRCHAATFRIGNSDCGIIVSVDGRGDGATNCFFRIGASGEMRLVNHQTPSDSICAFYQAITEALGFLPIDSEYKVMGLSAFGKAIVPNPFLGMFKNDRLGVISKHKWRWRQYNDAHPGSPLPNRISSIEQADLFRSLLDVHSIEDIARTAQNAFEEAVIGLVSNCAALVEGAPIFLTGGAFLNARANQRIAEALPTSSCRVFSDSSDGGLSIGAAIEAHHQLLGRGAHMRSLYLGASFSTESIEACIEELSARGFTIAKALPSEVAAFLLSGGVVGTFMDRGQIGPRALGNRSIIADAASTSTAERINATLKRREWFVPFAPSCLREDAPVLFRNISNQKYLMTTTVECTDRCREFAPAVVHVDNTSRPHIVESTDRGFVRDLLLSLKRATGIGIMLNTSFNRSGMPICGSPDDASNYLKDGVIDALVLGEFFVRR